MRDADLRKKVMTELDWEPSIDATAIGVAVKDGIVTLSGHVPSYYERRKAEAAAMRVKGVRGVAEEVEVKLPGSKKRTDGEIAKAAADAIGWHVILPEDKIRVRVEDGWVTLSGEVDWPYQHRSAEKAVRPLTGVRGVTNLVKIKHRPTPTEVKSKIESALERAAFRDAQGIKVRVEDGVVTLEGHVESFLEQREAGRAAWRAPGVTEVKNEIKVRPSIYA